MNEYAKIAIVAAVVGLVFAVLWRKGQLRRFANYVRDTREELKKCTWPTWAELRGSTIVVLISMALLGAFTFGVDMILGSLVRWLIS